MESPIPPPPLPPTPASKPLSLTVVGILNLVFGVIGLLTTATSYKLYSTPLETQAGLLPDLLRHDPFYASCMRILIIPSTLMVLAQVVSGIGLFQAREGARRLAIFCGIYGVLAGIVVGWLTVEHLMPFTIEETLKTVKEPAVAEMTRSIARVSGIVGAALGLLYPVLVIIFLRRKKVRDYCVSSRK